MFIAGCIVAGMGSLFLLLGIILFCVGKKTWNRTEQVTGTIVDMCRNAYDYNHGGTGNYDAFSGIRTGSVHRATWCPIYTYTVNGVSYTRASNVSWDKRTVKRKMEVPQNVYYNPNDPKDSSLVKQSIVCLVGGIFLLVGFFLAVIGTVFLVLTM